MTMYYKCHYINQNCQKIFSSYITGKKNNLVLRNRYLYSLNWCNILMLQPIRKLFGLSS